jgi:hypothetical protein
LVFAAVLVACVAAEVFVPEHVHKILDETNANHYMHWPDFKFEGHKDHMEEQDVRNLRRAAGDHTKPLVQNPLKEAVAGAAPVDTPNPHMANLTWAYPDNVKWLLQMFNRGTGIPSSYNDVLPNGQVYWGSKTYLEVGAFDEYGNKTQLDSIIAIQERTLTRYGLNLYDAATWQIALSLWNLYDVAFIYESNILYTGTTGPAGRKNGNPGGIVSIRADSDDFKYGVNLVGGSALKVITYPGNVTHIKQDPKTGEPDVKNPVKKGPGAMYYRIIGPKYQMIDPMTGNYDNSWKYKWPNPDTRTIWNTYGLIHFNDWKPITGENVWATMLGPLQALSLKTNGNLTNTTCGNYFRHPHLACDWKTFDTTPPSIQLGLSILPALVALKTEMGSLYHCPKGAKIFPPDADEGSNVSNENNFSAYASLDTLYQALKNYTGGSPSDPTLQWGYQSAEELVKGLDKWFDSDAILSPKGQLANGAQVVPQGGHINASGYTIVPLNAVGGLAVDCQTWGMTVMGGKRIDTKFGAGMAYNIWQTTKKLAGYYKGTVLAGVGYTDLTVNGSASHQNDIWSAEWTFGAINMAQTLSAYYAETGDAAKSTDLTNDAQSMYNELTKLWPAGLRFPDGSYVYANKRFFIPWGWFSNPISATCSTAWSVMQEMNYDPFHYGGGNKKPLQTPPHLLNRPGGMGNNLNYGPNGDNAYNFVKDFPAEYAAEAKSQ